MRANSFLGGAFLAAGVVLGAQSTFADEPRANGETIRFQNYSGSTGNLHAIVAKEKGFCEKYNFHCELATLNSSPIGMQALIGGTIEVAQVGAEAVGSAVQAGGNVLVVGPALRSTALSLSVASDFPLPNKDAGYPAIIKDLKGKRIGVAARGTTSEQYVNLMLADAGMSPSDVTYVAVGNPAQAYAALVVAKQIDALIMYEPITQMCKFFKTCTPIVDLSEGEGPESVRKTIGASSVHVMRRETAEDNPALMAAYYAAMKDSAAWFADPANFDEIVTMFTPVISFGDMEGGDDVRKLLLKKMVGSYSQDYIVKTSALQAALDFAHTQNLLPEAMSYDRILWQGAPTVP